MNSPATPAAATPAQVPTPVSEISNLKSQITGVPAGAPVFDARDRITILTPCYDFTLTEYYHASLEACKSAQAYFRQADGSVLLQSIIAERLSLPNDSHIDRARNVLANLWEMRALSGEGSRKCLWWDADIEGRPEYLMRTFLHLVDGGHKFVCGLYAMKCLVPTFIANIRPGAKPDPTTGLCEVLHSGTGWMAWDIEVLEKLRTHPTVKPYRCAANTQWPGKKFYAYFDAQVYGPVQPDDGLADWLSEDWMICQVWQELGYKVYADTEIKLRHLGRMLFPPSVDELVDAVTSLLDHHHPAIDIARIRKSAANWSPKPQKQAAKNSEDKIAA